MKKRVSILISVAILAIMVFQSCETDENGTFTSSHALDESHNTGQDCMSCHKSGGSGEGWFIVAGSMYDSENATDFSDINVKFYTESNGTGSLVASVQVDSYGNFYTTEDINFGDGIYTQVESNSNNKPMMSAITTGNCNSCHGKSVGEIWIGNSGSGGGETMESSYNDDESHKNGQNCMNCHKSGGPGEGWFNVAGSVYDTSKENPYPNATIRLYTEPNGGGDLVKTIEVDDEGNFYSTADINFGNGLYTLVEGSSSTKHMLSAVTIGTCNSCHGNTVDNIWVE